jgi:hypothetical protein
VKFDDGPPDLPGWWKGLESVVLMLVMILGWSYLFDRMPSFALGNTPVGWALAAVLLAASVLAMAAIAFAVFGGLGALMTRASLWVYRSRWRGQAAVRAEVSALTVEVRTLQQELDGRHSSMPPSPTPKGLAEQYQRVGATEESGRPAPAMRAEAGDDAAADRAARVATDKAARAASKAASSAAYLKTHGPST